MTNCKHTNNYGMINPGDNKNGVEICLKYCKNIWFQYSQMAGCPIIKGLMNIKADLFHESIT